MFLVSAVKHAAADDQQNPIVRIERITPTTSLSGRVCASNGLVFANASEAANAGFQIKRTVSHTVKPGSKCPPCDARAGKTWFLVVQQVCGSDGVIYNHPDMAKCAGVTTFQPVPPNVLLPRGTCHGLKPIATSGAAAGRAQPMWVVAAVFLCFLMLW